MDGGGDTQHGEGEDIPTPDYAVLKVIFCCSFSEKNWMAIFCLMLKFYDNKCVIVYLCAYVYDGVENVKDGTLVYIVGLVTPAIMEEE